MTTCAFCRNNSFHDGYCDHCGRIMGELQFSFTNYTSFVKLYFTEKYMVFTKSYSMFGAAAVGLIYDAVHSESSLKSFGMIDLNKIKQVTIYAPQSKAFAGGILFQFPNDYDLFLMISNPNDIDKIQHTLNTVGIQPIIQPCKNIKNIRARKPIGNQKTMNLIVSQSAAQFVKPFKKQITLDF